MTGSGTFTIAGKVDALLTGNKTIGPLSIDVTDFAISKTDQYTLAVGPNTIPVPNGTTALILVPDPTNTGVWKLKGLAGDTGLEIDSTFPFMLCPGAIVSFIIDATVISVVQIVWI